ncbi:hypothetical protein V501_10351 [Pseudogymnoascus sp. VKM F-4519 (FW-2642)]|nr:hypothetical protein V501_10351 [Pseudogymnoascus sp. VKM F-4519 (FW-2642)]
MAAKSAQKRKQFALGPGKGGLPKPVRVVGLTEMMPEEVVSQIDTKSSPEVDCAAGFDVLDAFSPANIQEWQRLSLEFPDFDEQPSKMDDSTMEMPIMSWDPFEEQLQPSPISDLPEPIASSWDDFKAETQQILAHANPLPTPASPSSLYSDSTERSRISRQPVSEFAKIFHAKIERDWELLDLAGNSYRQDRQISVITLSNCDVCWPKLGAHA